jgi:hypothetical protein
MKFSIKNLGPIKDAQLELGDLTIVCGKNNTGKTYLAYSFFDFLSFVPYGVKISPLNDEIETFITTGKAVIDLMGLVDKYNSYFKNGNMKNFIEKLPGLLAVHEDFVKDAAFEFEANTNELKQAITDFQFGALRVRVSGSTFIVGQKRAGQTTVECRLESRVDDKTGAAETDHQPARDIIIRQLQLLITYIINSRVPDAFIITCERTGASVFRNEFIIYKELALEDDESIDRLKELRERFKFQGYPLPIRKDLDFVLRFNEAVANKSFIAQEHPEIISFLSSVVGGEYALQEPNIVKFKPTGKDVSLTLVESSSSVRSLTELNFYLKHKAKKGQILMLDEPELNLHPEAQRKIARLLARLVNVGVKVLITTHSDYIIRELNALIMMKKLSDDHFQTIKGQFAYEESELLDFNRVKCYVLADGKTSPMAIDGEYGLSVESFDTTIEQFNQLYRTLLNGE